MQITVWTKPACVQCTMVKRLLTQADVPFEERDITAEENAAQLETFVEAGIMAAPITTIEGGGLDYNTILGFNSEDLKKLINDYKLVNA